MNEDNYTQIKNSKKRGLRLDILWVLVILAGFLFLISLFPLPPNDFWWHLKIGEYIYTNHSIPTMNMFAWTLPAEQPFFYGAWLAEFLFYLLYRIGGLELIIFGRTILLGITIWLLASETQRQSKSWRISAVAITILSLMILNNVIVRTQMWAWIPFLTTYIVLKRYTDRELNWQWLLLCPLSMIFWVNVHGSFILGLILPGAFFLGETISRLLKLPNALNWRQIGWIGCTGILSGITVLINPRFFEIITYTINLLTDPPSQKLIEEWQSPTPQGIANVIFYLSIIVFIVLLAYSRYRLTPTEIILYVGFLWLAWSGQRYVMWFGMIAVPILAQLIKDLPLKMPTFIPQKNWLNLLLAIFLFIPVLAVQPWFVERLPLPKDYWKFVIRDAPYGPLNSTETPVGAAEYLKSHPGGNLYNEMGYGSYLIWATPEQKVFIDPRVELYPYEQWMDYIHIKNGTNYNEILANYGVDRILLDKKMQTELSGFLSNDPLWHLEYDDQYSQIWSKIFD